MKTPLRPATAVAAILLAGALAAHQAGKIDVIRVRGTLAVVDADAEFRFVNPSGVEWPERTFATPPQLFEDNRPLGPGNSRAREIRELGMGRYRFDGKRLYFSSSDGTDPRVNGRSYRFDGPWPLARRTAVLIYTLLGIIVVSLLRPWWVALLLRLREVGASSGDLATEEASTGRPASRHAVTGFADVGEPPAAAENSRRDRLCLMAALAIVSANLATVWIDAASSSYVPCVENCAETFHVLKYVRDFHTYGTKYGLLELQGTNYGLAEAISPDPATTDKPLLYTHNPNLPGLLFVLLEAAGVHSLAGKQVLTLLAHGLGLLYGFVAVRLLTRSALVALIFCGLFATEYEMVFGFALNALRAWHWLALFGLIFHVARAVNAARPAGHVAAVALFAAVAMGMGYDFFAISLVTSTLVAVLFGPGVPVRGTRLPTYAALIAAFLAPVALRQIQVLSVMGFAYWRTDLFYSILTKVSVARSLVELPPIAEIEKYYATVGVYRPPTSSRDLRQTLSLTAEFLRYVTLPAFGVVTLAVLTGITLAFLFRLFHTPKAGAGRVPAGSAFKAAFCLAAGSLLGIALFADHNVVIFIKHKVPLIAAPILLAKAVAIGLLIDASAIAGNRLRRAVLVVSFSLLGADHLAIQYFNLAAATPYRHTWIDSVGAKPYATYGVSWDPTAVSVFANTNARAVTVRDELAIEQLAAAYRGTPAAPRLVSPLLADLPDYWLYFPTDGMSPFDSFSPDCRLDYLSAAVLDILRPAHPAIQPGSWVRPIRTAPGGYVLFGGSIAQLSFRNAQIVKIDPPAPNGAVATNCRSGTFTGWIQTSDKQRDGKFLISLGPQDLQSEQLKADLRYEVAANASPPDFDHPALLLPLPRPSVAEMRRRLAPVPVVSAGPTWVLFDLRGLKRRPVDQPASGAAATARHRAG